MESDKKITTDKNASIRVDADNVDEDINYLLELNNSDIVREVIGSRDRYSWNILNDFSNAIEYTLKAHKLGDIISRDETSSIYYDNYINDRIPAQNALMTDREYGPIPDFYVLSSNVSENINIVDSLEECIIERNDTHYGHYMAFKLSLVPKGSITQVLDYHLAKYFNKDRSTFQEYLKSIADNFNDILGNRTRIVLAYTVNLKGSNRKTDNHVSKPDDDQTLDSDSTVEQANHRQQIMMIHYMLSALSENYENAADKIEIARFIIFLTGKNTGTKTKNTSTYKLLSKILVKTEKTNIRNLQTIRPFFERLMLKDVLEMIDKEIANAN